MGSLTQDFRFALRSIARRPLVAVMIVMMLALGLGANGAIFSVIDALVFRPVPIADVDRMVMMAETSTRSLFGFDQFSVAPANFLDWREHSEVFQEIAAYDTWSVNLEGQDEPERVQGMLVSPGFFEILGVDLDRGRAFLPEEEERANRFRAVLGHGIWTRRFGADPAVVGQTIRLDGETYSVVGIAPPDFDFPMGSEVWAPLSMSDAARQNRTSRYLTPIARLRDDRSFEDAVAELDVIDRRLKQEHPEENEAWTMSLEPLAMGVRDQGAPAFLGVMQAAAGLVLLIACANIANLLLARGSERSRELAVRTALGAGRHRLFQLLFTEALILSIAGGALSLLFAWIGLDAIRSSLPANIVRFVNGWKEIDVDGRLIALTFGGSILTAVTFGCLPALRFSNPNLNTTIKEGGRGATGGAGKQKGRNVLVVAQIAMALSLLVGAGLSITAMQSLVAGPHGFDADGKLISRLTLPASRYEDPAERSRFVSSVLDELRALPGVTEAVATNVIPGAGNGSGRAVFVEGEVLPDPSLPPRADYRTVSAGYFETMGIPIVAGRPLAEQDGVEDAPLVAIVSRSMAERHWPGEEPIGKRLKISSTDGDWLTVVGVSGDVIHHWVGSRNEPTLYRPYAQAPTLSLDFAIATMDDPLLHADALRAAVLTVDPGQPISQVQTLERAIQETTIGIQYAAGIMSVLGVLALILSAMGIYGVMAYLISQRTHEIGIRTALGASSGNVLGLIFRRTAWLTLAGTAVGLVLAVGLGRLMESALFGTVGLELGPFLVFGSLLASVSLIAGYIPTRRALRVDPITVLRSE